MPEFRTHLHRSWLQKADKLNLAALAVLPVSRFWHGGWCREA
jgi:hypothetical protein